MSRKAARRIASSAFSLVAAIIFPRKPFSIREAELFGLRVLLYIDQRTCQRIYLGVFEKDETRFLLTQLRAGDVCLDIGANIGYYSFLFATKARQVIAVEPIKVNADLIRLTASLNNLGNIKIICAAAGGANGQVEFAECGQTGYSSVNFVHDATAERRDQQAPLTSKYSVPAIAVDGLGLQKLDIVKIDVEGYEFACLNGMLRTLVELRPRLLMVELVEQHLSRFGYRLDSVLDLLAGANYIPKILKADRLVDFVGQPAPNDNFFFVLENAIKP